MKHWSEVRSAYAVARLGTVSAASAELGVHRATIIRHINTLEASLGARLFQRHTRGYTPRRPASIWPVWRGRPASSSTSSLSVPVDTGAR